MVCENFIQEMPVKISHLEYNATWNIVWTKLQNLQPTVYRACKMLWSNGGIELVGVVKQWPV